MSDIRSALTEDAARHGVDIATIDLALNNADPDAMITLVNTLVQHVTDTYALDNYIRELIVTVDKQRKLPQFVNLFVNVTHYFNGMLSRRLEKYTPVEEILPLLRHIDNLNEGNASGQAITAAILFQLEHQYTISALNDLSIRVREVAANHFIDYQILPGLAACLENDAPRIVSKVAWHIGRENINALTAELIAALSRHRNSDSETLRSIVWAIGRIRARVAREQLVELATHDDELVRIQIQETLKLLDAMD